MDSLTQFGKLAEAFQSDVADGAEKKLLAQVDNVQIGKWFVWHYHKMKQDQKNKSNFVEYYAEGQKISKQINESYIGFKEFIESAKQNKETHYLECLSVLQTSIDSIQTAYGYLLEIGKSGDKTEFVTKMKESTNKK